jgi:hypothetical protein
MTSTVQLSLLEEIREYWSRVTREPDVQAAEMTLTAQFQAVRALPTTEEEGLRRPPGERTSKRPEGSHWHETSSHRR